MKNDITPLAYNRYSAYRNHPRDRTISKLKKKKKSLLALFLFGEGKLFFSMLIFNICLLPKTSLTHSLVKTISLLLTLLEKPRRPRSLGTRSQLASSRLRSVGALRPSPQSRTGAPKAELIFNQCPPTAGPMSDT